MAEKPPTSFPIPAPDIVERQITNAGDPSVYAAVQELTTFATGWDKSRIRRDWWLRTIFKVLLFGFVVVLNGWWAWRVMGIVKESGTASSGFHLDNSVLIALVTTSIANFIALVAIVARHLFPSDK